MTAEWLNLVLIVALAGCWAWTVYAMRTVQREQASTYQQMVDDVSRLLITKERDTAEYMGRLVDRAVTPWHTPTTPQRREHGEVDEYDRADPQRLNEIESEWELQERTGTHGEAAEETGPPVVPDALRDALVEYAGRDG